MSLRRFALTRLVAIAPILVGVSLITFGLVHLTPGDPVSRMVSLNPDISPAEEQLLRRHYGLDGPVWEQYLTWLANVATGDLGIVVSSGRSVSAVIAARLPTTIALGLVGWIIALAIAIPTGIYAGVRKDSRGDDVSRLVALAGISIPNFWLGLLLILVFASWLDLWPVLPPREPLYHPEMLWYLLLPGLTIGTGAAAVLMRIMRSAMAEELNEAYVTTARAKGLPERTVLLKHVLRNSLISVVTVAAFLTAGIVAGAVVVEVVFTMPGLGAELHAAVLDREVNLIVGITLVIGLAVVLANLLADVVYALLDPRIREGY